MGETYLIDTNALLDFLGGTLPPAAHNFLSGIINEQFNVSVINRLEILGHPSATETLTEFMNLANTYQLGRAIEELTIAIRKQKKIKLPDAIIAATALAHGLTIVSRNVKDFQHIDGLKYINPHDIITE